MREPYELLTRSQTFPRDEIFREGRSLRFSPIVWLNLACLDAPLVAVAWQWIFARSFHIPLSPWVRIALFLTAWLIYLADRFADTLTLPKSAPNSQRQEFCSRHQREWMVVVAAIALCNGWIILRELDLATLLAGAVIGALALGYLAVNYWLGKIWRFFPAKEICVGLVFALGTVAALLPKLQWSMGFAASFLAFAALCSLNCISIAVWERQLDQAQNKNSIATSWTGSQRYLKSSVLALVPFTIVTAAVTNTPAQLCYCIVASAISLGLLDWLGRVVPRDERTALADLVLLTPLFVFLAGIA
jgi:hypothetical protein